MTYDMPQSKGHNRYENPIVKNSFVKKFKKQKRKNNGFFFLLINS